MSAINIGTVTSGKTYQTCTVYWDSYTQEVFVGWAGQTYIGKASSAGDAMNKAEAWLYNK